MPKKPSKHITRAHLAAKADRKSFEHEHAISQTGYWREIRAIAKDAKREVRLERAQARKEKREPRFELSDMVHQKIDGHAWIIYIWAYPWILLHSRNESAVFEDQGPQQAQDYAQIMQLMSFYAMQQDVNDVLGEMGAWK